MIKYTAITFLMYLIWSFSGFALHVLGEMGSAKKLKGARFKVKTFLDRNLFPYLGSLVAIIIGCGLLASSRGQVHELPPIDLMGISIPPQFWLVLLGYTGGSAIKKLLKSKVK